MKRLCVFLYHWWCESYDQWEREMLERPLPDLPCEGRNYVKAHDFTRERRYLTGQQ